jgi:hypothetical protein
MDTQTRSYIRELNEILACEQSDGYLKEWARERLERMNNPFSLISIPVGKTAVAR